MSLKSLMSMSLYWCHWYENQAMIQWILWLDLTVNWVTCITSHHVTYVTDVTDVTDINHVSDVSDVMAWHSECCPEWPAVTVNWVLPPLARPRPLVTISGWTLMILLVSGTNRSPGPDSVSQSESRCESYTTRDHSPPSHVTCAMTEHK